MKKLLGVMVVLVLCSGVQSALATAVVDVDGDWTGWTGGYNVNLVDDVSVLYGNGDQDQIRWGKPAYGSPAQSGLGFTGVVDAGTAPEAITYGVPFEIGQLAHFNFEQKDYTSATEALLSVAMTISDSTTDTVTINLNFAVDETLGVGTPDIISFPSGVPSQVVTLGGVGYTFDFVGFGPDADNLTNEFVSVEGGTNTTLLFGRLTPPVTVPAPGALLLSSIGVWAVGMVRRRRAL